MFKERHTHQRGSAEGLGDPAHRCDFCSASIGTTEAVEIGRSLGHGSLQSVSGFDHGDLSVNIIRNAAILASQAK